MKIDWFKYKIMILQKIAKFLGVRAHVYKTMSKEKNYVLINIMTNECAGFIFYVFNYINK